MVVIPGRLHFTQFRKNGQDRVPGGDGYENNDCRERILYYQTVRLPGKKPACRTRVRTRLWMFTGIAEECREKRAGFTCRYQAVCTGYRHF